MTKNSPTFQFQGWVHLAGTSGVPEGRLKIPLRFGRSFLLGFLLLFSASRCPSLCAATLHRFEFNSPHMGTLFTITLYAKNRETGSKAAESAFHRVADLDQMMTDYREDSELMKLCAHPANEPVKVSRNLFDILERAEQISAKTDGAFDVTVGPLVRLWRDARKTKKLPSPELLAATRARCGWRNVKLNRHNRTVTLLLPNMQLDLGGIAKGYAADEALKLLKTMGVRRALVAASGDIAIGDPPPEKHNWTVGLTEIDERSNKPSRTVSVHNAGVSTSGDTEQAVEIEGIRYSHIVDPATGLGLTNRIQVSVIAPDATTTDAMATALCVMGKDRALALVNSMRKLSALVLVKQDGQLQSFPSSRFKP